jgi:hypothetical protein
MPKTTWETFAYATTGSRRIFATLLLLIVGGYLLGFVEPYFYK